MPLPLYDVVIFDYFTKKVTEGEELFVKECKLSDRQTSPPGYLTESDLITLMEKHGIGTDASIPVHINSICTRCSMML